MAELSAAEKARTSELLKKAGFSDKAINGILNPNAEPEEGGEGGEGGQPPPQGGGEGGEPQPKEREWPPPPEPEKQPPPPPEPGEGGEGGEGGQPPPQGGQGGQPPPSGSGGGEPQPGGEPNPDAQPSSPDGGGGSTTAPKNNNAPQQAPKPSTGNPLRDALNQGEDDNSGRMKEIPRDKSSSDDDQPKGTSPEPAQKGQPNKPLPKPGEEPEPGSGEGEGGEPKPGDTAEPQQSPADALKKLKDAVDKMNKEAEAQGGEQTPEEKAASDALNKAVQDAINKATGQQPQPGQQPGDDPNKAGDAGGSDNQGIFEEALRKGVEMKALGKSNSEIRDGLSALGYTQAIVEAVMKALENVPQQPKSGGSGEPKPGEEPKPDATPRTRAERPENLDNQTDMTEQEIEDMMSRIMKDNSGNKQLQDNIAALNKLAGEAKKAGPSDGSGGGLISIPTAVTSGIYAGNMYRKFAQLCKEARERYSSSDPSKKVEGLWGRRVSATSNKNFKKVLFIIDLSGSMDKNILSVAIAKTMIEMAKIDKNFKSDVLGYSTTAHLIEGTGNKREQIFASLNKLHLGSSNDEAVMKPILKKISKNYKAVVYMGDFEFNYDPAGFTQFYKTLFRTMPKLFVGVGPDPVRLEAAFKKNFYIKDRLSVLGVLREKDVTADELRS